VLEWSGLPLSVFVQASLAVHLEQVRAGWDPESGEFDDEREGEEACDWVTSLI